MLELTDGARERIRDLRSLSARAEGGDEGVRQELRAQIRESTPEVIASCANATRVYRRMLSEKTAAGSPLVEEATRLRAELVASELAGENPTPLEVLLSERVASLWILVELQEALMAAYYSTGGKTPLSVVLQMARLQESTHRRYLAAIKTLAQVQKMRGPQRVQVNIGANQVNLS